MSGPARCADQLTQSATGWSTPLLSTRPNPGLVSALARALLAGEPGVEPMVARCAELLGHPWRWLRPLARRYWAIYRDGLRPRHREVERFLRDDVGLQLAWARHSDRLTAVRLLTGPQQMQPLDAAQLWKVPAIDSVGALSQWLGLDTLELAWFADLKGWQRVAAEQPRLRHYHYRVMAKRSGSLRLIESPKGRLKGLQRRILRYILERIPAHPAAHGFAKGRSIRTFAEPHAGRRVVLRMDLKDFFPSITRVRVQALFRTAGYPELVADLLGGICANIAPRHVWNGAEELAGRKELCEARELYARPHLPQGAPTSPALANLCAFRLDCRLAGLARSAGAVYTRYADDLAFSGDEAFERGVERFSAHVAAILLEEGFTPQFRKTRIMRQGVRQRLAGLVVNRQVNVSRAEVDRLKAILTNCVRQGPTSQNRENRPHFREHLAGRVGFVEMVNAVKGRRLRKILEQIPWGTEGN